MCCRTQCAVALHFPTPAEQNHSRSNAGLFSLFISFVHSNIAMCGWCVRFHSANVCVCVCYSALITYACIDFVLSSEIMEFPLDLYLIREHNASESKTTLLRWCKSGRTEKWAHSTNATYVYVRSHLYMTQQNVIRMYKQYHLPINLIYWMHCFPQHTPECSVLIWVDRTKKK